MNCDCDCNCQTLNITAGTDITLAVTLRRDGKLFPVELSEGVKVNMVSQIGVRKSVSCRIGSGKIAVPLLGEDFPVGTYGIEITGKLNDAKWRTFGASVVKYTFATQRGAARVITNGDTYDIELEVGAMSDIVPTSLSELTNDIGAVTDKNYVHTDNNFTDELKDKLVNLKSFELVPAEELPEASEATMYKIYLVPTSDPQQQNVRDEFVTVHTEEGYEWEQIGSTAIDLSNYYTKEEVDDALGNKQDVVSDLAEIRHGAALGETSIQEHQDISGKVDKEAGKGLSSNDYTTAEKTKLAGLSNYDDTEVRGLIAGKQDTLTWDNTPTAGSNNPVKSSGIKTELDKKADNVTVIQETFPASTETPKAVMVAPNTICEATFVDYMDFGLDASISGIKNEYCIKFDVGSTIPTLTLPSGIKWSETLVLYNNMHYVLLINYENGAYYCDWRTYNIV